MKHRRAVTNLGKFLVYVLGRRPDEFGLIPDADGYVTTKNLLKAMGEEAGWRYVRLNHLREVVYSASTPLIEIDANRIRAVDRTHLKPPIIPMRLPTILHCPIRQRAYPVILEKGRGPGSSNHRLLMSDDPKLARRLGRRIDADPVILMVNSAHAVKGGASIWRFGKHLFLADELPLGSFSGPPLPKQQSMPPKKAATATPETPPTPGSYLLDMTAASANPRSGSKAARPRKRKNEWKRERKRKHRNQA